MSEKWCVFWPGFPLGPRFELLGRTFASEREAARYCVRAFRRPWFWLKWCGFRVVRFG